MKMVLILDAIMKAFPHLRPLWEFPTYPEKGDGLHGVCISIRSSTRLPPPRIDLHGILPSQADSRREFHVLGLAGYRYVPVFAGRVCSLLKTSIIAGEVSV